jgi:hypothetical protein
MTVQLSSLEVQEALTNYVELLKSKNQPRHAGYELTKETVREVNVLDGEGTSITSEVTAEIIFKS